MSHSSSPNALQSTTSSLVESVLKTPLSSVEMEIG
jgi:hypothetical protein